MEQEVEFKFPPMKLVSPKDMDIDWSKWTAEFGNCECLYQEDREKELFDLLKIWNEKK